MKKKEQKKKITLDGLAMMVGKGFAEMDKRFEGVEKRFEGVDKRFDEFKIYVDKRFDIIENELFAMGEVLKLLREDVKEIRNEQIALQLEVRDLRERVAFLERKLGVSRK